MQIIFTIFLFLSLFIILCNIINKKEHLHNLDLNLTNKPYLNFIQEIQSNSNSLNKKALGICQYTNPHFYINQSKFRFKSYDATKLPKNIDLQCWDKVYNC